MMRIAITTPEISACEAEMIAVILDEGWDYVHLRHPGADDVAIEEILKRIPESLHGRIRLHGHVGLLDRYNLGGIHLSSKASAQLQCAHSRSCHSIDEVLGATDCDYVTLSPVFDSLSKRGYRAVRFDFKRLESLPHPNVIALGGVTPERLAGFERFKFDGFAAIGAVFSDMPADWEPAIRQRLHAFDIIDNN